MAGRMINGAAALAELIRPASDTGEFGTQRVLPVLPELSNLLPSRGLRRGSTIAIGITPGASVHQGALPTPTTSTSAPAPTPTFAPAPAPTFAPAPTPVPTSAALPLGGIRDLGDSGLGGRRDSPRSASATASAALPPDGIRDLGDSGLGGRRDSPRSASASASAALPLDGIRDLGDFGLGGRRDSSRSASAALPLDDARDLGGFGLGERRDSPRSVPASASAALPFDGTRDLGDFGLGGRRDSPRSVPAADVEAAKGPSGRSHAPASRPSGDSSGAGRSDGASPSRGAGPRASNGGEWTQERRGGGSAGEDAVTIGSADSASPFRSPSFTGGSSFGEVRFSSLRGTLPGAGHVAARGALLTGSGSTSLLLALLAAASSAGSWCAVVGVPTLGALAAAESGIALDRLALVPDPGPEWPTVVAALIDGVDVVVIAVPGQVSPSITSRLVARARQRGCVLMPYGRWDGADVTLQVTQGHWEGLGAGHGRLRRRKVTIVARGRGTAARPKEITMWMPGLSVAPPHDPAAGIRSRPTAVPPQAITADEPAPSSSPATGASTGSAPLASVTPILFAASASPPAAGSEPAAARRLANGERPAGAGCA